MPKINVTNFNNFGMCSCCRRTTASYYNSVAALAVAGGKSQGTNSHSHIWQLTVFRTSDGESPPGFAPATRIFPGQQGLFEQNHADIDTEWAGVVAAEYVDFEEDVLSECDLVSCNYYDLGTLPRGFTRDSYPVPQNHRTPLAAWLYNGGILCIHMLGFSGDPEDYNDYRDADLYIRANSFIQWLGGTIAIVPQILPRVGLTFNNSLPLCLGCPAFAGTFECAPVTGGIPVAYCAGQTTLAIQRVGQGWLLVGGCHAELPPVLYKNLLEGNVL